jgi:DNA replication licensing factor MCM3
LKPILTKEAADMISEEYTKLRNQDNLENEHLARTQPVTARSLETLIRLATAHAKSRLSNKVEPKDADVAIELVRYACFKKVMEKEKRNKRKEAAEEEEEEEEIEDENMEEEEAAEKASSQTTKARKEKSQKRRMASDGEDDEEEEEDEEMETQQEDDNRPRKRTRRQTQQNPTQISSQTTAAGKGSQTQILTSDKLKDFKTVLFKLFHRERAQALPMNTIVEYVYGETGSMNEDEVKNALNMMQDDNQVMLSEGTVFLI